MIVSLVIELILSVLSLIVGLIPNLNVGFNVAEYLAPLANVVGYLDAFISVPAVLLCLGAVIVVDNFNIFVRAFTWLWDKIPFL